MISAAEIKSVRNLSSKKARESSGTFAVEGEKMVQEALASNMEVVRIYRKEELGEATMARMSQLTTPPPVIAVLRIPREEPVKLKNGLYLVLDSIRDPGNMGTIIRIAEWFGINAVIASPDSVERFNPKVVQATMGALFRVQFHSMDVREFGKQVLEAGGSIYGTFLDGTNIYHKSLQTGADRPVAIVIGNESNGISAETASLISDRLYIPPYPPDDPGSESLNAAVATAVTLAEFRRRID